MKKYILETERLLLRPWQEEDLEDLYTYAKVAGVGEMAGWTHHKNMDTSRKVLNVFIDLPDCFALVDKKDQKVIGSIALEEEDLLRLDGKNGRNLGYVLNKDYWNRGLMPEAVERILYYAFKIKKYDYIMVSHFIENSRSRRVIERAGFNYLKDINIRSKYQTIEKAKIYILENEDINGQ